jgi:uncharacterized sulfatase
LWLQENGCDNWKDYFQHPTGNQTWLKRSKEAPLWKIPEKYHYNTWIAERSNKLLEEYAENEDSFFLWASFLDPHAPRILPEPWDKMYNPEEMKVPEKVQGEHERNPPHFKFAQADVSSNSKFKKIFKSIGKSMRMRRFKKYYKDFSKRGLPMQGLHGMHPHFYNRETLKSEIAAYYGMVSLLDKYIGKILDKLSELGLRENTIVVFTTDHGDFFGQHGLVTKGPFHYEDLIKIPFIVRSPNNIPANEVKESLLSLIDVPPTFLSLLDLPIPEYMSGIDQSGVWKGVETQKRDHILCENHHSPTLVHLKTFVNDRYKITVYNNEKYGELFDLKEDPNEFTNLWDEATYFELKSELLFDFCQAELQKDYAYFGK